MLAEAIDAEVNNYLEQVNSEKFTVTKNGLAPERVIQSGIGPIKVQRQKLRSKGGKKVDSFTSKVTIQGDLKDFRE